MNAFRKILGLLLALPLCAALTQCAIVDDIPFPLVEGSITSFEVEGQSDAAGTGVAAALIDNDKRTIQLYVDDTVDITRLRITRLQVSYEAEVEIDKSAACNPEEFPTNGFLATTDPNNTRVDFTRPVRFTLHTYQDYEWTVTVTQIIDRRFTVKGQVGESIVDATTQTAIVYVSADEDLSRIRVEEFSLGGQHGTVTPDPTQDDYTDFRQARTYSVTYGWSEEVHEWTVFAYITEKEIATTAQIFPHTVSAFVSGEMQNGLIPVIDYRIKGQSEWKTVSREDISLGTAKYSATISGLKAGTNYELRVTAGTSTTEVILFTTYPELQLENPSFDNWTTVPVGKNLLYQPWAEGASCYWDTGNRGATTVGASNSTGVTEGNRTFANLQSKYIVIKFAAGNIFTGEYLATDGTNGILGFGRPFTSFPTALRFDYKFKSSTINKNGGAWNPAYGSYITQELYEGLKGKPDSCQIYIALLDDYTDEADRQVNTYDGKAYPYLIRTRPSTLHLFDANSPRIIAYAQMTQGKDVNEWTTETIHLNYRAKDRTPKYILVVASSSKYGDYFTGGETTLLQLDNLRLLYE